MEFHELRQRIRDFEEDRRRQRDCICGVKKENVQLKQCNEALQQHSGRALSERHRELRACRGCLLDQLDHTAGVLEERSRQLAAARARVRSQDKIIKEMSNNRTCSEGITAKLESLSELRSDNRGLVDENMKLESNCKCDLRSANLRLQEENAKYEMDNSSLRSALSQLERTVADYEQRLSSCCDQGSISSAIPPHWLEGATVRRMRPGLCGQDFRPRALVASLPLDQVLASDDVTPCGRERYTFVQSFNVFSADTHTRVKESPQSSEEALPETRPDQRHDRDDCLCELRKLNERLIQENAQYEVDNAELHVTVAELEKQLQDNVQLASCNCELKKLNEELKEENMKYKVENDGLRKQMAAMEGTISNYEDHIQDLQRNYEAEKEEIKKETMELVEENAKFECENSALSGEVRTLQQSVEALKQEYEQKLLLKQEELECLSGIQEANDQIIEENKTYAETIHKLEESISRMRKEYELKLRKQGEEAELSELQASMVAWEKDLAGRDQRVKQHEDRIKTLEEQLSCCRDKYASLNAEYEQYRAEAGAVQAELQGLRDELELTGDLTSKQTEEVTRLMDACASHELTIQRLTRQLTQNKVECTCGLKKENVSLKQQNNKLESELSELRAELEELRSAHTETCALKEAELEECAVRLLSAQRAAAQRDLEVQELHELLQERDQQLTNITRHSELQQRDIQEQAARRRGAAVDKCQCKINELEQDLCNAQAEMSLYDTKLQEYETQPEIQLMGKQKEVECTCDLKEENARLKERNADIEAELVTLRAMLDQQGSRSTQRRGPSYLPRVSSNITLKGQNKNIEDQNVKTQCTCDLQEENQRLKERVEQLESAAAAWAWQQSSGGIGSAGGAGGSPRSGRGDLRNRSYTILPGVPSDETQCTCGLQAEAAALRERNKLLESEVEALNLMLWAEPPRAGDRVDRGSLTTHTTAATKQSELSATRGALSDQILQYECNEHGRTTTKIDNKKCICRLKEEIKMLKERNRKLEVELGGRICQLEEACERTRSRDQRAARDTEECEISSLRQQISVLEQQLASKCDECERAATQRQNEVNNICSMRNEMDKANDIIKSLEEELCFLRQQLQESQEQLRDKQHELTLAQQQLCLMQDQMHPRAVAATVQTTCLGAHLDDTEALLSDKIREAEQLRYRCQDQEEELRRLRDELCRAEETVQQQQRGQQRAARLEAELERAREAYEELDCRY
ncbi:hypothetical protein JYU34_002983, partial [Plutella xylostella]